MKIALIIIIILTWIFLLLAFFTSNEIIIVPEPKSEREMKASWYGYESCVRDDCLMANGKRFDPEKISCASRTYYGQTLTIRYKDKTIECPVTDKISVTYDAERVDLSKEAFRQLESLDKGLIQIAIIK